MIIEFFQALFSDAPKWAKQQDLVKESVAIGARYQRQKKFWASHLENCQAEIRNFQKAYAQAKKIAVLGSGHLLDFPQELLERPDLEFFLFDAVHPREIRKRSFRAKCHFISRDLNLKPSELRDDILNQCDIFISTNLLSQLALSGSQHLKSEQRETFAKSLVENHMQLLKSLPGPTLLLSDFEKRFISSKDEEIVTETTLWGYSMASPRRTWWWSLAPKGEISNDFRLELQVGVWQISMN